MRGRSGGLVYSTDSGRMCPVCRQPVTGCLCKAPKLPTGDGTARIGLQTKGRGGKSVTVVRGLLLDAAALEALGKTLRTACGSGGTVKDGTLEIQGDHVDRVAGLLQAQGFKVRRQNG